MQNHPRPRYSLKHKLMFVRGKVQRFLDGHFRKAYVARRLALRKGECKRCGACCQLLSRCPFAAQCQSVTTCRVYNQRPINCRTFPYEASHFAERDLVAPGTTCGYYFED